MTSPTNETFLFLAKDQAIGSTDLSIGNAEREDCQHNEFDEILRILSGIKLQNRGEAGRSIEGFLLGFFGVSR